MDSNIEEEKNLSPYIDGKLDITASFDMGWQQRGSGHIYNSSSGHGFMIGCRSRKVSN